MFGSHDLLPSKAVLGQITLARVGQGVVAEWPVGGCMNDVHRLACPTTRLATRRYALKAT